MKFASASQVFPKHRLTLLSPLLLSFRSFIVAATASVITVVSLSLAVVFWSRSVGLLKIIHRFHANNVNRVRSCVNIVTRRSTGRCCVSMTNNSEEILGSVFDIQGTRSRRRVVRT